MNKTKKFVVANICLLLMSVIASGGVAAYNESEKLMMEYESEEITYPDNHAICLDLGGSGKYHQYFQSPDFHLPTIRQRPIEINQAFYNLDNISIGATIVLNLFENATFISNISSITEYPNDHIGLRGDLEGFAHGFVVFAIGNETVLATVEIPENNQRFVIMYEPKIDMHFVYEVDVLKTDINIGSEPLVSQNLYEDYNLELLSQIPEIALDPSEEVVIRVGVYYTYTVLDWDPNIFSRIVESIETANTILENSNTNVVLELGDWRSVNYPESDDLGEDLRYLTYTNDPYDDYLNEVHDWRNQYAIDLVVLLVDISWWDSVTDGPWGIAWTLSDVSDLHGEPDWGFSVVAARKAGGGSPYVFTHEIGHNLGCKHHRDDPQPGPTDWGTSWENSFGEDNDWSAAHREWFSLDVGGKQTVMARGKAGYGYVPYLSNPDIDFVFEDPMYPIEYTFTTGTDTSNNARTIRMTKHMVSSYRNKLITRTIGYGDVTINDPDPLYMENYLGHDMYVFGRGFVRIDAIPYEGYIFSHWSGDVPSGLENSNPLWFFVDGDKELMAHFIREPEPAQLELHGWNVNKDVVTIGNTVEIRGWVRNVGGEADGVCVDLIINGAVVDTSWEAFLNPGEIEYMIFEYTGSQLGMHDVLVYLRFYDDSWQGQFEVIDFYYIPFKEDFTGVPAGEIPERWTRTHSNWGVSGTDNAEGTAPELMFDRYPTDQSAFQCITPAIDTSGFSELELSFKHYLHHAYSGKYYSLNVRVSNDGTNWKEIWWIQPNQDIGPETITFTLGTNEFIGSNYFYISWYLHGNSDGVLGSGVTANIEHQDIIETDMQLEETDILQGDGKRGCVGKC